MKTITWFFLIIISSRLLTAQNGAFYELTSSRFARATSMGNTYTGIAEGAEAAYYNNAGFAFNKIFYLAYSDGHLPLNACRGLNRKPAINFIVGLFVKPLNGNLSMYFTHSSKTGMLPQNISVFNISYSKLFSEYLSLGAGVSYYHSSFEEPHYEGDPAKGVFDFHLSGLFKTEDILTGTFTHNFGIGFQLNNLLSSDYSFFDENHKFPLSQDFRLGVSYTLSPEIYYADFHWIKLLGAFDGVWYLSDYKFNYFSPGYGVELTMLDLLSLRFGKYLRKELSGILPHGIDFKISTWGLGLNVPLRFIFHTNNKAELIFDIAFQDWGEFSMKEIEKPFFTIQLCYDFLK